MDTSAILRAAGLRVTVQRIAVLQALALAPHSPADRIHTAVEGSGIALPTVHAILGDLATAGIIRRVSLPDADRALFEVEPDDNHHHMQCVRCGRLEVVACAVGASPACIPPRITACACSRPPSPTGRSAPPATRCTRPPDPDPRRPPRGSDRLGAVFGAPSTDPRRERICHV